MSLSARTRAPFLPLFALGGALVVACSTGEADADLTDVLAAESETPPEESTPLPTTEPSSDGGSHKPDAKAPPSEEYEEPPSGDGGQQTPPTQHTKTCSSGILGYTSLATITYTKSNGVIEIDDISALVVNLYGLNKNNLSIYVKTLASTTYTSVLVSGDILTSGIDVPVPFPKNLSFDEGDTLRIDTYFDVPYTVDPFDSCFVQL